MTEEKMPVAFHGKDEPGEARRPYVKPAIAEEESYDTCATLSCTFKSPGSPGCGGRGGGTAKKSP